MLLLRIPYLSRRFNSFQDQGISRPSNQRDGGRLKVRTTAIRQDSEQSVRSRTTASRQNSELSTLTKLLREFGLYKQRRESVFVLLVPSVIVSHTVIVSIFICLRNIFTAKNLYRLNLTAFII